MNKKRSICALRCHSLNVRIIPIDICIIGFEVDARIHHFWRPPYRWEIRLKDSGGELGVGEEHIGLP